MLEPNACTFQIMYTGIVFGSFICVICVISCEHDNFWGVLNCIFKLEPYIDHINVSDEFENW